MNNLPPPSFDQFVQSKPQDTANFIDVTILAKNAGFYFSFTGLSQTVYYQAIDVPNRAVALSPENLTRQLLKLAWRAARKDPSKSEVSFAVCVPPSADNVYVNRPLDLIARIEHNPQGQPILIITTMEEHHV
ncbi:TPA: hypothetical protein ACN30R_003210 [Vibrio parahaemolyticus]|nr:hypothetical protein [Vibrio parahaemolyticus]HBC3519695.1 hypothetical protein [Vibrio parahaemolyticus]